MDPGHDLATKMQEIALEESARFILKRMSNTRSYRDATTLMRDAFARADLGENALIVEFGVGAGMSINRLAEMAQPRKVYGFDWFAGLPETWRDGFEQGAFRVDAPPAVAANVELVVGLFDQTLPGFLEQHPEPVAFVHFDCDLYTSTKSALDHMGSRLRSRSVLLFDEFFNYPGWQRGEYRAFSEFIAATSFEYEWLGYCRYHEQVAVQIL